MPFDKVTSRIDAKLDAIIEKLGIKAEEVKAKMQTSEEETTELTPAEQDAINNAPKTPAAPVIDPATGLPVTEPPKQPTTQEQQPPPATPATETANEETLQSRRRSG